MQEIMLRNGGVALVDDEAAHLVSEYKWYRVDGPNTSYAQTTVFKDRTKKTIRMHRLLIGDLPCAAVIDHANRNGLDNRTCNLRVATFTQNQANTTGRPRSTSRYKGVSIKRPGVYFAQIQKDKKKYSLGYFLNEEEAAVAYNKKALELFGEFAFVNKISKNISPQKLVKNYKSMVRDSRTGRYVSKNLTPRVKE